MRHILISWLCATAVCASAAAAPILAPAEDYSPAPEFNQPLQQAPQNLDAPAPGSDYEFLRPAGAGITMTGYFAGIQPPRAELEFTRTDALNATAAPADDSDAIGTFGMVLLCLAATVFVFIVDAWGGRRRHRRRRYQFVLDTKPEYPGREAA